MQTVFRTIKKLGAVIIVLSCFTAADATAQGVVNTPMLERLLAEYGGAAQRRGQQLDQLLRQLAAKDELEKLTAVNDFFNEFLYQEDRALWGEADYWATPEEFIGLHSGDCEDYVIAKYFALISVGVESKKLYLTYVKALGFDVSHMVLTYFEKPNSIPLVLDNYNKRILSATERKDLRPVYSFNAEALFLTNASAGLAKKLPTDKVKNSKWDALLKTLEESAK